MNNIYFDFIEIGKLKLDKIFFESYYPILFTCINEKKELFLCVCVKSNSVMKKWLISKINPQIIIDLLTDKITIRDAFLKDKRDKYTIVNDLSKKDKRIEVNNQLDWDSGNSTDLPSAGEYMDVDEDEFFEEIKYYKLLKNDDCIENYTQFNISYEINIPLITNNELNNLAKDYFLKFNKISDYTAFSNYRNVIDPNAIYTNECINLDEEKKCNILVA